MKRVSLHKGLSIFEDRFNLAHAIILLPTTLITGLRQEFANTCKEIVVALTIASHLHLKFPVQMQLP